MSSAATFEIEQRRDAFLRLIGLKPLVVGILNLTPDSFSDGGQGYQGLEAARAQAKRLADGGADILDIAAEVEPAPDIRRFPPTKNGAGSNPCSARSSRRSRCRSRSTPIRPRPPAVRWRSASAPASSTTSGGCNKTRQWRQCSGRERRRRRNHAQPRDRRSRARRRRRPQPFFERSLTLADRAGDRALASC